MTRTIRSRPARMLACVASVTLATGAAAIACGSYQGNDTSSDAGASTTDASVATPDAKTGTSAITLVAITPGYGDATGGTTLTLTGTGFVTGASVTIAGAKATVLSTSTTSIDVTLPKSPGALGYVPVVVSTPQGGAAASSKLFRYYSTHASFVAAPSLAAVSDGAGTGPLVIGSGDLRGTGTRDLLVAATGATNAVSVLLGNKNGSFATAVATGAKGPAHAFAIADLNGDSRSDLIYDSMDQTTLFAMLALPDGGLAKTAWAPMTFGAGTLHGLTTAKGLADTRVDLLVTGDDGVLAYGGAGDGTFGAPTFTQSDIGTSKTPYDAVALADLDGDAKLDMVFTTRAPDKSLSTSHGHGDGSFAGPTTLTLQSAPFGLTLRDVDGAGPPEILISDGSSIFVFSVDKTGTLLAAPATITPGLTGPVVAFVAADLNGDSTVDLACANASGDVSVLLGNGRGVFTQGPVYAAPAFFGPGAPVPTLALHSDDFDGDGRADLAVAGGPVGTSPAVVGVMLSR